MLFLCLSAFTGFIIFIVLTWMGPLMYLYDGHVVYEYSFLVDLYIMNSLVQVVSSFGQLQKRYGSFKYFAMNLPLQIKK